MTVIDEEALGDAVLLLTAWGVFIVALGVVIGNGLTAFLKELFAPRRKPRKKPPG